MLEKMTKYIIKTILISIIFSLLFRLSGCELIGGTGNEDIQVDDEELTHMIEDANKLLNGTANDF